MTYLGRHARRILTKVDVAGFGDRDRHGLPDIQSGLDEVLQIATDQAGLDARSWTRQDEGAGKLAIHHEDEPAVVDAYVRELHTALIQHNRGRDPQARLRLRLAIHFGTVTTVAHGITGRGVALVNRLADSDLLKHALVTSDAELAVILSEQAYRRAVVEGRALASADLHAVTVAKPECGERAWIYVPGQDLYSLNPRPRIEAAITTPQPGPRLRTLDFEVSAMALTVAWRF